MLAELEDKLWKAGSEPVYDEALWRQIVDALLADFRHFLSTDFEIEPDLFIDPPSDFSIWFWSQALDSPISIVWSAVLAGGPIDDPDSNESFAVSVDLFLFHEFGKKRLYSDDGLHFLQFAFTRSATQRGSWHFLGWQKDEFGEWENLVYEE